MLERINHLAHEWQLIVEESLETETSVISFVRRNHQSLVLKVVKQAGDEWQAGRILSAFEGQGVARVYEHSDGAMLLERLRPGNSLAGLALSGQDEEATKIIGDVIQRMPLIDANDFSSPSWPSLPTVEDWAKGFARYLANDDRRIPRHLVESAQRVFANLCASQRRRRLLHGDLHHYNLLFDSQRGWLAIDPKGVIGELEYEIGAVLRNPVERPDLFVAASTIERRIDQLTGQLHLNAERVVAWAFSQAVLSAIWDIEDGFEAKDSNPALRLAEVMRLMLPKSER